MKPLGLSPREMEIVELCCEGLTNDAIAYRLGLSVGTVNTYWLRIKLKTGGFGRTDAVVKVVKEQAEQALEAERIDWEGLAKILVTRGKLDAIAQAERILEYQTSLALISLALDHLKATVWSTDSDLSIHMVVNGQLPADQLGMKWAEGSSVYDVFNTTDDKHPAVAAHIAALAGTASTQRLSGEFAGTQLKVNPLADDTGEVLLCISILSRIDE
jgi:DNA-binding CsgD family transcriptional regulator